MIATLIDVPDPVRRACARLPRGLLDPLPEPLLGFGAERAAEAGLAAPRAGWLYRRREGARRHTDRLMPYACTNVVLVLRAVPPGAESGGEFLTDDDAIPCPDGTVLVFDAQQPHAVARSRDERTTLVLYCPT